MSCDNCLATAIRAKLGRCPVCAGQTFVIGLVGWLVWWVWRRHLGQCPHRPAVRVGGLGPVPAPPAGVHLAQGERA